MTTTAAAFGLSTSVRGDDLFGDPPSETKFVYAAHF